MTREAQAARAASRRSTGTASRTTRTLEVWNRLVNNFWLPEKVPLSNDIQSWNTLTPEEQTLTMRVFTGLTLLDTIQGTVGAVSLIPDAITPHEEAVYTNIAFMESVHAKSYSLDLLDAVLDEGDRRGVPLVGGEPEPSEEGRRSSWTTTAATTPLKRKVASHPARVVPVLLGLLPADVLVQSRAKLTNTADLIRLIIRDEAVHGYYIGYKFQKGLEKLSARPSATSSRTTRSSCSSSSTTTRCSTRRTSTTASA